MNKNLFLILALTFVLSSCGSLSRAVMGDNEENAIKNLSITSDCPVQELKVISKRKVSMQYRYQIEGCGKIYDTDFSGHIYSEKKLE